jgi:hypothetical protein
MTETKNPYGYDIVDDIQMGGRYLAFRRGDKGRVIQLRLVTAPKYVNQHWILGDDGKQSPIKCKGEDCPYCGKQVPPKEKLPKQAKWGWVVVDREDGQVKLFTGPTLIARKIKEISEAVDKRTKKPIWGNPLLFDISIERTEEPGAAYYQVTPIPEGKGNELTASEKKAVEEAKIDVATELEGSKDSKHTGNYGATDLETVTEPTATEVADEVPPVEKMPF